VRPRIRALAWGRRWRGRAPMQPPDRRPARRRGARSRAGPTASRTRSDLAPVRPGEPDRAQGPRFRVRKAGASYLFPLRRPRDELLHALRASRIGTRPSARSLRRAGGEGRDAPGHERAVRKEPEGDRQGVEQPRFLEELGLGVVVPGEGRGFETDEGELQRSMARGWAICSPTKASICARASAVKLFSFAAQTSRKKIRSWTTAPAGIGSA